MITLVISEITVDRRACKRRSADTFVEHRGRLSQPPSFIEVGGSGLADCQGWSAVWSAGIARS
jgi:hypothetical protein